jgi:hypothetical protein
MEAKFSNRLEVVTPQFRRLLLPSFLKIFELLLHIPIAEYVCCIGSA